jgi:hypothetical protein
VSIWPKGDGLAVDQGVLYREAANFVPWRVQSVTRSPSLRASD